MGETQGCFSFFWMQMFRLGAFIILLSLLGVFSFITTTKSFIFVNYWSLLLSTLTFGCLFIGAGMQVCEQKLLLKGKTIDKKDESKLWIWGIFFYNQALPFVVSSYILFSVKYYHLETDWDTITSIFYTKSHYTYSYRWDVILFSHRVPMVIFLIDMCMNKIRIPWNHVVQTLMFTSFYLFVTYVGQIIQGDEAVYFHRLNWNCRKDCSFLQSTEKLMTISNFSTIPCSHRPENETMNPAI